MRFIPTFLLLLAAFAASLQAAERSNAVLAEINFARTHPDRYADALSRENSSGASPRAVAETISFLRRQSPLPALALSQGMSLGAGLQVAGQSETGDTGHTGSDHSSPWDRMAHYGQWQGGAGENISYGHAGASAIVASLIIDEGVFGHDHRKNIFSSTFGVAGIACGSHPRYGAMCVIDFAGDFVETGKTASVTRHAESGIATRKVLAFPPDARRAYTRPVGWY